MPIVCRRGTHSYVCILSIRAGERGGRESGRQFACLRFIPRIKAEPFFAAEIHILAASTGPLAHHAMMHLVHVVAVVVQPDALSQTFGSRLRAWGKRRRSCQWRKRDSNSQSQAPTQRYPD
jgi:hypothetical protein